ncbi:group I intron-associated PD-(D/E)XK endonuclease [Micromonospora trifolii]|uniref:group I intron-associated PD-(D/E)XK endonuclease n=1 Tax=Micromonospora trifolii TaxID=2911208 RepID=UPI003D2F25D3
MIDAQIRPLYESGQGCRVIATALSEHPAFVYKRVVAMGIARSRDQTYAARQAVPDVAVPFASAELPDRLRAAAIGEAIAWFLRRGYLPSIPVEPTRYDLVVESDDGLKRVQVKSTTHQDPRGRYVVGIAR